MTHLLRTTSSDADDVDLYAADLVAFEAGDNDARDRLPRDEAGGRLVPGRLFLRTPPGRRRGTGPPVTGGPVFVGQVENLSYKGAVAGEETVPVNRTPGRSTQAKTLTHLLQLAWAPR